MELALAEAQKCTAEGGHARPKVGVVLVGPEGRFIASAHRGELSPGEHGEYTALERKVPSETLVGATVYATLEPCTTRNHPKVPCAQRLVERRVARVVIGMLDPNPNILGRGVLQLRAAGIAVEFFPVDLMSRIEELNRDFIRVHGAALAPALNEELLRILREQSLDDWYVRLNRMYWNRNFQREATAVFAHIVEVMGSLTILVTKKRVKGPPVHKILAKALAWWFALCGKVGIKSVADLLWGKFPLVCPYCESEVHAPDPCNQRKRDARGPNWSRLAAFSETNGPRRPKTIAQWQRMFATIYPPSTTDDVAKTFAKLTEEIGELAEAVRVFSAAPGYFLSEAADVFAWLMKLSNLVDEEAETPTSRRGDALGNEFALAYPGRCLDCNASLCSCPPILASTIGRIAHEVPPERSSFDKSGSFMTQESAASLFGLPSPEEVNGQQ
jgi:pyrimidine deaminase RibD-like protein/NTP pyrophosphatase (non-canonical NTP hydrolase)